MCRVKKLFYTRCNHYSGVMPAYEDEWCQYKQAYPVTSFEDCPNSNKGNDVQAYPEYDYCPDCKYRGVHRNEIEARAQAVQATIQAQGVQAILPPAPVYQPLQPNPYQAQGYEQAPSQQQQVQYAPDPNQQAQYAPDPCQQHPEYQAAPEYYGSAPGSPVDQGYHQNPRYPVDPNAAAGQQQGYTGDAEGSASSESVGQVFDSVFTPPANPYNPNYPGNHPR